MLKRIKSIIRENRERQKQILLETQELKWSQIYHDSIRGEKYLQNLSLNIGRWAGNYSFFYVLNRILREYKPQSILEFGLGESSKFISIYLDNYLLNSTHTIIEHNETWANLFKKNFILSKRSEIKIFPLEEICILNYKSNVYKNLSKNIQQKFDLYVVDGPIGSKRYSRYDIVRQIKQFDQHDEFIIIFDDYNRQGEKDTVKEMIKELMTRNIPHFVKIYGGSESQFVIATKKYKLATSL